MNIYLSSAYLAPIEYYAKFLVADRIFVEQHDNYAKQTYRNRCTIAAANGPLPLSIPVEHASGAKTAMKDIRIAEHGNWRHLHWNAIVSAYSSSAFFEYYQDDFYPFYHRKFEFLLDFNEGLQQLVLDLLNIDHPTISYTDEYKQSFDKGELDLREVIHPKKNWRESDPNFISVPYYQVFDQKFGFQPNLSIVDLLFNMGNESLLVLMQSNRK